VETEKFTCHIRLQDGQYDYFKAVMGTGVFAKNSHLQNFSGHSGRDTDWTRTEHFLKYLLIRLQVHLTNEGKALQRAILLVSAGL